MANQSGKEPEHTGQPGCPACARIEAELSSQEPGNQELANALLRQFDDMVDNVAGFVREKGRQGIARGLQLLDAVKKDIPS